MLRQHASALGARQWPAAIDDAPAGRHAPSFPPAPVVVASPPGVAGRQSAPHPADRNPPGDGPRTTRPTLGLIAPNAVATAAVAAHARTSADVTRTTKSAASVAISTAGVRLARQITYDGHATAPAGIDHRSQRAGLDVVACAGARQHADPVPLRQRLAQRGNARACRALMRDLANAIPARPRCPPPNRCRHSTGRHRRGERLPRFGQERSRKARPPHRRGLPLPRRPRPCARHRGGIPRPRTARRRVRLRRREGS